MRERFPPGDLPEITVEQMREVDRVMVDELGIRLVQMMENAGRNLADLALARYQPVSCTVLAGPGGNGGGGLVAARHLHNRGVDVQVALSTHELTEVPGEQLAILRRMGVGVADDPPSASLVIDALVGYSLRGDPRGRTADLVRWANTAGPILSLDVPSGLDGTTGRVGDPCATADATLTLALPKTGLRRAPRVVGDLYVADISVPPAVYARLGVDAAVSFASGAIVRLDP